MSRNSALVLVLAFALASLTVPAKAYAQLTPPAGSAGVGNSAISGVPFGPANPSVLSDPSGILNASKIPPLGHQRAGAANLLWRPQFVAATPIAVGRRHAILWE